MESHRSMDVLELSVTRTWPITPVRLPIPRAILAAHIVSRWVDIAQCVKTVRESEADEGLPRIPIFGNGDAYDYRTYYENMEASGVDGIMLARGALIKVCCPRSSFADSQS